VLYFHVYFVVYSKECQETALELVQDIVHYTKKHEIDLKYLDTADGEDNTALHYAADMKYRLRSVVEELLSLGAKVTIKLVVTKINQNITFVAWDLSPKIFFVGTKTGKTQLHVFTRTFQLQSTH